MAVTVGPVTDEVGVAKIPKGAPIQIGGYWVLSGADAALGTDQKRGAEFAENRTNVEFCGVIGNAESRGDFFVAQACG